MLRRASSRGTQCIGAGEGEPAKARNVWAARGPRERGRNALVSEALCFGWIDGLVKRVDDDRFAIEVTPRKPTSRRSDINRKR